MSLKKSTELNQLNSTLCLRETFFFVLQIFKSALKFSHRFSDLLKICSYSHSSSSPSFFCCCGVLLFIADRLNCIGPFNVTGSFVHFLFNCNQQIKNQKITHFHLVDIRIHHSYSDHNKLWNFVNRSSYEIQKPQPNENKNETINSCSSMHLYRFFSINVSSFTKHTHTNKRTIGGEQLGIDRFAVTCVRLHSAGSHI